MKVLWSGNPFGGWKTALIFLAGGAITGAITGKALDFYCGQVEQRLIRLERERVERETRERERIEREKLEREALERKRISREIALESNGTKKSSKLFGIRTTAFKPI
ncbi:hypothetical protein [Nostoc commune]|uniref:hypothetical protein n=1 Tax=Nostoc commune TaxID=1178 RepID=UPI0018C46422|nr:hypothetical protein [Nostoc commune]MBG1264513.1 hypothetical protein [Nostoc commune BAE]